MPEETTVEMTTTADTEMVDATDAGNRQTELSQADFDAMQKALKKANGEAAANRKALQAFQDAEAKRKEAEMTEVEKLNARIVEMTKQQEADQQSIRETRLNAAIDVQAKTLKYRKVEEARALIKRGALEYGDDGQWSGVDEALKALAKDSPHLIEQATMPDTDGTRRNQAKATTQDDAALRTIAERYGIKAQ